MNKFILLVVCTLLSVQLSAGNTRIYTKQQEWQLVKEQAAHYISKNEGRVMQGNRHVLYDDANGKALKTGNKIIAVPTIGYGRNVMDRGLSEDEAMYLLNNDVEECMKDLQETFPWYDNLPIDDKVVMVDLRFNLGRDGLLTFKNFLAAMERGDKVSAKKHLLSSKYATQTGPRAKKNAEIIGK